MSGIERQKNSGYRPKKKKTSRYSSKSTPTKLKATQTPQFIDFSLTIISAHNVPKMDCALMGGKCDPYVKVITPTSDGKVRKQKTKVKNNTLEPVWNESLSFNNVPFGHLITVELMDKDKIGSEFIGKSSLDITTHVPKKGQKAQEFTGQVVLSSKHAKKGKNITIKYKCIVTKIEYEKKKAKYTPKIINENLNPDNKAPKAKYTPKIINENLNPDNKAPKAKYTPKIINENLNPDNKAPKAKYTPKIINENLNPDNKAPKTPAKEDVPSNNSERDSTVITVKLETMNQLLAQVAQFAKNMQDIKGQVASMQTKISQLSQQLQQQTVQTISSQQSTLSKSAREQILQSKDNENVVMPKKNENICPYNGMYRILAKEDFLVEEIQDGEEPTTEDSKMQQCETLEDQAQKIKEILSKELKEREIPASCKWLKRFIDLKKSRNSEWNKGLAEYTKSFIRKACQIARMITMELGLPSDMKSIHPVTNLFGDTKYIHEGMVLKLASDTKLQPNHYLYGGNSPSWERSAKASAAHIRGANSYFSLFFEFDLPVVVPIEVILDFNGYRFIAMPLLPLEGGQLVYGSGDGGQIIYNDNFYVNDIMRFAAQYLHLCSHNSSNGKMIHSAGDVKVHIGSDGRLYVLGFRRAFPPEASNCVLNLDEIDTALFFRMFRPEFVQHLKHKYIKEPSLFPPLNPDALSKWGISSPARDHINVEKATNYLLEERVTQLAEHLNNVVDTTHISSIFHEWGMPIRHISLVKKKVKSKIKHRLLREMVQRSAKHLLRKELRGATRVRVKDINETVAHFLNTLMQQNYDGVGFWTIWLPREIHSRFGKSSLDSTEESNLFNLMENDMFSVLTYICQTTGFDLDQQHWISLRSNKKVLLSKKSIIAANVTWKTMNFLESLLLADLRNEFIGDQTLEDGKRTLSKIAKRASRTIGGSDLEFSNFCAKLEKYESQLVREMWDLKTGKFREIIGTYLLKLYHGEKRDAFILATVDNDDFEGIRILEKISNTSIVLLAAKYDRWDLINTLINNKFNMNAQNIDGHSAVLLAAQKDKWDIVDLLLESKCDIKPNGKNSISVFTSACEKGVWNTVKYLINAKVDVNTKSKDEISLLRLAMDEENWKAVLMLMEANVEASELTIRAVQDFLSQALLNYVEDSDEVDQIDTGTLRRLIDIKVDINMTSENGLPLLLEAAKNDNHSLVVALLNLKASVDSYPENNGMSALHYAAKVGNSDTVKILLQAKSEINKATALLEETPLVIASSNGHKTVVKYLIAQKAEVNFSTSNGNTALIKAAMGGYPVVIQDLLNAKANINIRNEQMDNALIEATKYNWTDSAKLLLRYKANPHFRNKAGNTALLFSATKGNLEIVQCLLICDSAADVKDVSGKTALILASSNGFIEVVEALLKANASVKSSAKDGTTAMYHAATGNHDNIIRSLFRQSADVNAKDNTGYTPLIAAACNNCLDAVRELIRLKANINAITNMKESAMDKATKAEYADIIDVLTFIKKDKKGLKIKRSGTKFSTGLSISFN